MFVGIRLNFRFRRLNNSLFPLWRRTNGITDVFGVKPTERSEDGVVHSEIICLRGVTNVFASLLPAGDFGEDDILGLAAKLSTCAAMAKR